MAWDFNRHHVAKKVLERHMGDLDRKQASISNRRDENLRDLHRELINLQTVTTPDLRKDHDILRQSRRHHDSVGHGKTSKSISLPTPSSRGVRTPPDVPRTGSGTQQKSRLTNRRQSEPMALGGRDVSEIQRIMNKAFNLSTETPDERWNKILQSTLQAGNASGSDSSRLTKRRGTVACLESTEIQSFKGKEGLASPVASATSSRRTYRRGSLPINDSELKSLSERSTSANSKKLSDDNATTKKQVFPRRNSKPNIHKLLKKQNGVNVTFYNEDTGEESIPTGVSVPSLNLNEADSGADDSSNASDGNLQGVWRDLANCRYIRGYNPPEMRTPDQDPATFVFGRKYNDVLEAQMKEEEENV